MVIIHYNGDCFTNKWVFYHESIVKIIMDLSDLLEM